MWHAEDHYGPYLVRSYNVHGFVYIPDDAAETFECSLNDIAAFPFENFLGKFSREK